MKVGVIIFPGSNCDRDTIEAVERLGMEAIPLWYTRKSLTGIDRLILPGGFSYGDYLRSGALAAQAPIMEAVEQAVSRQELPVLGICNGFQILCERGLLPGALRPNSSGEFRCTWEYMRITSVPRGFAGLKEGDVLRLPIAHHEGAYAVQPGQLQSLFENHQIFLQYSDETGSVHALTNPNGAVANVAGISQGLVVGLMPHPERAMASYLGSSDGQRFLKAWLGEGSQ
ncbi:MAG: phosphoribosylformylglycinamidine synthase I [Firmicutes bacterium]|jgi:phosphoribosylformylglycinamidine synthase|uniref:Phosphoribosylformylglycinamidine synthase subunit PurQ n=1 Tax=Sulfobacillus benefaciens TaxID=453960 RepID=A0A2T2X1C9_9FIRM|nr:phosphoribosylformylglycinamidine synthase I [Bacillota bacterium]MCL5015280.1 phosphoribosylformylglycinamidine synthase I [Bacillota bacterium]PSR28300.1 MAG: phosphoribosylformylglycinamidine synthase I [Sulfobacillus benefaciens]